jgi:superfamily I DNA/RNA helicase/RecB family exonuclease
MARVPPVLPGTPAYRLVRPAPRPVEVPNLDDAQQAVVDHRGGPLLVLAGPGTGKTATIVEAVAARIDEGLDPEQVLVLTFGRRAAAELRSRVTARLGRATKEPLARTFHSYAFGLLRREAALRGEPAPRLLSGPEQDLVVRDLLAGDLEAGAPGWPERLRAALPTRGFAQELRDLVMRAYERGVTATELERLGRREGRDDWRAAARFMRQYAGVTALRDAAAYDPAELIRAVVGLWLRQPGLLDAERAARPVVFVDELQDTDPAQVELLRLLAGGGRDLVAVGDPDQSIYGFRGADVGGIHDFPQLFPSADGSPAPVLSLRESRRAGPTLLAASRRVARGLGGRGRHRDLAAAGGVADGTVAVAVLRSETQEAAMVAAHLREAHLVDGVPWSRMAVLVRSTARSMPVLRRAMRSAGVPVEVPGDEVPLTQEPAVRPLLALLTCAVEPDRLDEETAVELVTSALGGADAMALRRLRQELRRAELAVGGRRASGPLLVEALREPVELVTLDGGAVRPAQRVAELLALAGRAAAEPGATAETVLWAVWSHTGLAARWERASLEGGQAGEAADRDLDAVVALFEAAARFCDRLPAAGPEVFLDHLLGQQIPGEDLAPRAPTNDAVQVLTAHAAKGLEWDVVCVPAVQEGTWPDLRMRGSFLGSERLVDLLRRGGPGDAATGGAPGRDDRLVPTAVATATTLNRLLEEERRLFYVAVTRARRSLLVTAVTSEREGLAPSRFLEELDPLPREVEVRPLTTVRRPLSLTGLVSDLRQAAVGTPSAEPADEGRRLAAAQRLAVLAAAGARGADPDRWWGLPDLSDDRPIRDPDQEVAVSPSKVESFQRCRLRWFLEHVGGGETSGASQNVGTLVHAVAEGAVDAASSTERALLGRLDELLRTVDLGTGWIASRERGRAEAMVRRLASWLAASPRELVAVEEEFAATVGRARLGGRVDRIERDELGRAVVVDLKTGSASSKPSKDEVVRHSQLATYQLAVEAGAFAHLELAESGGAELVQVGGGGGVKGAVQAQPALADGDDPGWARELVLEVAEGMAGSAFTAVSNKYCPRCPVRTSCPVQDEGRTVTS